MKNHLGLFFAVILALGVPVTAWSQSQIQTPAKVYTKKVRMGDFLNRMAKVVTNDSIPYNSAFKTEVTSRWRVSPYEFCTPEEYERLHTDNDYYFLHFTEDEGVGFLTLDKGGEKKDPDTFKRPFTVIKAPVGTAGKYNGREGFLLGALLDIIQNFSEEAMTSDNTGYAGLTRYNRGSLKGKTIYFKDEDICRILDEEIPGAMAAISITPASASDKALCYRMLISADTHELFYYTRERYREDSGNGFNKEEINSFKRRHAVIVR